MPEPSPTWRDEAREELARARAEMERLRATPVPQGSQLPGPIVEPVRAPAPTGYDDAYQRSLSANEERNLRTRDPNTAAVDALAQTNAVANLPMPRPPGMLDRLVGRSMAEALRPHGNVQNKSSAQLIRETAGGPLDLATGLVDLPRGLSQQAFPGQAERGSLTNDLYQPWDRIMALAEPKLSYLGQEVPEAVRKQQALAAENFGINANPVLPSPMVEVPEQQGTGEKVWPYALRVGFGVPLGAIGEAGLRASKQVPVLRDFTPEPNPGGFVEGWAERVSSGDLFRGDVQKTFQKGAGVAFDWYTGATKAALLRAMRAAGAPPERIAEVEREEGPPAWVRDAFVQGAGAYGLGLGTAGEFVVPGVLHAGAKTTAEGVRTVLPLNELQNARGARPESPAGPSEGFPQRPPPTVPRPAPVTESTMPDRTSLLATDKVTAPTAIGAPVPRETQASWIEPASTVPGLRPAPPRIPVDPANLFTDPGVQPRQYDPFAGPNGAPLGALPPVPGNVPLIAPAEPSLQGLTRVQLEARTVLPRYERWEYENAPTEVMPETLSRWPLIDVPEAGAGISQRVLLEDPQGRRWIYKTGEIPAHEVGASQLARLFGVDDAGVTHAEMLDTHSYANPFLTQPGTLQPLYPGSLGPLYKMPGKLLSPAEQTRLQIDDLFRWLSGDIDAHSGNVILTAPPGGAGFETRPIDRGRAFWQLNPSDLSTERSFQRSTYVNRQFDPRKTGPNDFPPPSRNPELAEWIRKAQQVPDEVVRQVVEPVLRETNDPTRVDIEAMIQEVLRRKRNLLADAEHYYGIEGPKLRADVEAGITQDKGLMPDLVWSDNPTSGAPRPRLPSPKPATPATLSPERESKPLRVTRQQDKVPRSPAPPFVQMSPTFGVPTEPRPQGFTPERTPGGLGEFVPEPPMVPADPVAFREWEARKRAAPVRLRAGHQMPLEPELPRPPAPAPPAPEAQLPERFRPRKEFPPLEQDPLWQQAIAAERAKLRGQALPAPVEPPRPPTPEAPLPTPPKPVRAKKGKRAATPVTPGFDELPELDPNRLAREALPTRGPRAPAPARPPTPEPATPDLLSQVLDDRTSIRRWIPPAGDVLTARGLGEDPFLTMARPPAMQWVVADGRTGKMLLGPFDEAVLETVKADMVKAGKVPSLEHAQRWIEEKGIDGESLAADWRRQLVRRGLTEEEAALHLDSNGVNFPPEAKGTAAEWAAKYAKPKTPEAESFIPEFLRDEPLFFEGQEQVRRALDKKMPETPQPAPPRGKLGTRRRNRRGAVALFGSAGPANTPLSAWLRNQVPEYIDRAARDVARGVVSGVARERLPQRVQRLLDEVAQELHGQPYDTLPRATQGQVAEQAVRLAYLNALPKSVLAPTAGGAMVHKQQADEALATANTRLPPTRIDELLNGTGQPLSPAEARMLGAPVGQMLPGTAVERAQAIRAWQQGVARRRLGEVANPVYRTQGKRGFREQRLVDFQTGTTRGRFDRAPWKKYLLENPLSRFVSQVVADPRGGLPDSARRAWDAFQHRQETVPNDYVATVRREQWQGLSQADAQRQVSLAWTANLPLEQVGRWWLESTLESRRIAPGKYNEVLSQVSDADYAAIGNEFRQQQGTALLENLLQQLHLDQRPGRLSAFVHGDANFAVADATMATRAAAARNVRTFADAILRERGAVDPADLDLVSTVLRGDHAQVLPGGGVRYRLPRDQIARADRILENMGVQPGAFDPAVPLTAVKLGGRTVYLPEYLANEATRIQGLAGKRMSDILPPEYGGQAANGLLRMYKTAATLLRAPPYIFNQFVGAPYYAQLGEGLGTAAKATGKPANPSSQHARVLGELMSRNDAVGLPRFPMRAADEFIRTDKGLVYHIDELDQAFRDGGLFEGQASLDQVASLRKQILRSSRMKSGNPLNWIRANPGWFLDRLREFANAADQNLRVSTALELVDQGVEPSAAAARARKASLDFRSTNDSERRVMSLFFTWYSFMRANADIHFRTALLHPERVAVPAYAGQLGWQMAGQGPLAQLTDPGARPLDPVELAALKHGDLTRIPYFVDREVTDEQGRKDPRYAGTAVTSMPQGAGEWLGPFLAFQQFVMGDEMSDQQELKSSATPFVQAAMSFTDPKTSARGNRVPGVLVELPGFKERFGIEWYPLRQDGSDPPGLADPQASAERGESGYWAAGEAYTDPDQKIIAQRNWQTFLAMFSPMIGRLNEWSTLAGTTTPPPYMTTEEYRMRYPFGATRPIYSREEVGRQNEAERTADLYNSADAAKTPPASYEAQ